MPASTAQQLVALIGQAVQEIEADIGTQIPGGTISNLNLPIVAREDGLEASGRRREGLKTLQAATHQLLSTLMPSDLYIFDTYASFFQKTAIDTVVGAGIPDLIHSLDPDASQGGVHVQVLAQKTQMDSRKLSHILRFLALRNIFCELTENHWANNRHSFPLRTDSSNSVLNALGHMREEIALPALVQLPQLLLDKQADGALSMDPQHSAFQKYYKPGCNFFEFLAKSDGGYRAERFGKAMFEMTQAIGTGEAVYQAFDWQKLGPSGTLIDVGGGVGAAAYALSTYLPGWKVVVQDRAEVVKDGQENYQKIGSSTNLEFEEADFFEDQPARRCRGADAYFLRHVLHDWPFTPCVQILSRLRKAAKPTTSLLICETVLNPPLTDPNSLILFNGGMASVSSYTRNLSMMTLVNAEERTQEQFVEILNKSGWKLQSVTPLATLADYFMIEGIPDPSWKQED
ncbi:uncharacterized protein PGTG_16642 [Puccinia graminis f. sp. tritici CRL 75-36-700-3]|uniref:O-methyltransferase C-terminal domain-containing protein n=1 Tax=Puccinia graminis f. sp. tritici (strain CRL 75-36-700-3 / race SCCL) TaxID=418459 RepID=E3L241_PUCGT|nr:uncharacterized protein PGTG_16642 [Puccinia graminis f. sp. tritici CRL 75-36-700-3]EFP90616.2 hypothetical protein PGTG_16642 [Puccinia graminis f. sp. tritici CRL 75-36-700-3]